MSARQTSLRPSSDYARPREIGAIIRPGWRDYYDVVNRFCLADSDMATAAGCLMRRSTVIA